MDPGIKPWSEGMESVQRAEFGRQRNETGLLELADLKRKQAAEQEMFAAIQNDPVLRQQVFGGSTLASIGPAGGPPGGGPMTQQQVRPGQPPGTPQMVPG